MVRVMVICKVLVFSFHCASVAGFHLNNFEFQTPVINSTTQRQTLYGLVYIHDPTFENVLYGVIVSLIAAVKKPTCISFLCCRDVSLKQNIFKPILI